MAILLSGENDGKVVKEKQSAYSEKFSDAQGEKSAENKEIQKPTEVHSCKQNASKKSSYLDERMKEFGDTVERNKKRKKRNVIMSSSEESEPEEDFDSIPKRPKSNGNTNAGFNPNEHRWSSSEKQALEDHFLYNILEQSIPTKADILLVLGHEKRLSKRSWKNVCDQVRYRIKGRKAKSHSA